MDNPYIEVPDPLDISKRVKARVLKFKLTDIQPFYAEIENGDRIRMMPILNQIAEPLDNNDNPIMDPKTGKKYYNFSLSINIEVIEAHKEEEINK